MSGLMDALIRQESGGRPGVLGPPTKYGRAQGLTQMLPPTAASMAQKIGVPWRPDLMTAKTDEGAAYQRKLGEAYLQEGIERTGNTRDALRYYHGGPDRRQWGPKTNAYADQVLAYAGNDQPMPISQMPQQPQAMQLPQQMPMPQDMLNQPMQSNSLADMIQMQPMNLPQVPEVKPKPFDQGGKGWVIAGIIADAIAGGFGGKGGFAPAYSARQEQNREAELYRQKAEEARAERMRPQLREVGGQLGMADPATGGFTPTYQPPPQQPQEAKDLAWWNSLGEPEKAAFLRMKDAISPIAVGSPETGYSRVPRQMGERQVVRTGTAPDGSRVVQYSDGSIERAE